MFKLTAKNKFLALPYLYGNPEVREARYKIATDVPAFLMKQSLPVCFSITFRQQFCQYISIKCATNSTLASPLCKKGFCFPRCRSSHGFLSKLVFSSYGKTK